VDRAVAAAGTHELLARPDVPLAHGATDAKLGAVVAHRHREPVIGSALEALKGYDEAMDRQLAGKNIRTALIAAAISLFVFGAAFFAALVY